MIKRPGWVERITQGWSEAPIVWLSGVRRVGKTTLARQIAPDDQIVFANCDLPEIAERLRQPALFYRSVGRKRVVFDEIHQLDDPARILKIGADEFPRLRILATGSSTLAATHKFRDTLTGRKRTVQMLPVLWNELDAFGVASIEKRLAHGGLPDALLASAPSPAFYREWIDSFFARDIQKLFAVRNASRFTAFLDYMLRQSGGVFDASRAASDLGISRPTVLNHLQALEVTHAMKVVRPFHSGHQKEIVKAPKVYGFDTGFVCFARGWHPIRQSDLGILWEHFVLEQLQAERPDAEIRYWREKSGREVDFVIPRGRQRVDLVECKWNPKRQAPSGIAAFRERYPVGSNYVVAPISGKGHIERFENADVSVISPNGLRSAFSTRARRARL